MKIHGSLTIGKKNYVKGDDVPWYLIYPAFFIHIIFFGGGSFWLAYGSETAYVTALYYYGAIISFAFIFFYFTIFGLDNIKWMLINFILGIIGIHTQYAWLVSLLNKNIYHYPFNVNIVPFISYVLFLFLLRQLILDITKSHDNPTKKNYVEFSYVFITLMLSVAQYYSSTQT